MSEYIVRDPMMHGGRPTIRDSRVDVATIARYHKSLGYSPVRIARALPTLTIAQVHAALAYYFEHEAEMDRDLRREDGEVERQMRRARRKAPSRGTSAAR